MDTFSKKGCDWTKTMETQKMKNALQQKLYVNCRFSADLEVYSPQQQRCDSTGKRSAVGNCIYFQTLTATCKKTTSRE